MLTELITRPEYRSRYWALPILGTHIDAFSTFLFKRGYHRMGVLRRIRGVPLVEKRLKRMGCRSDSDLLPDVLADCGPAVGKAHTDMSAGPTVRLLGQYFYEVGLFKIPPAGPIETKLLEYGEYLKSVRGFAPSTAENHLMTSRDFLGKFCPEERLPLLRKLSHQDIESYVCDCGKRIGRGYLQHIVARLRGLLRYLASRGEVPLGLDLQIDTPRLYRGEKLPRSLPWNVVRKLLKSIDTSRPSGMRDYAMLCLVTTYGLRVSEVIDLKLEDLDWRKETIRVPQIKAATPLILPLTQQVGNAILRYLKKGRPPSERREVFLRHRTPAGMLARTAVSDAFRLWSRRSGLPIPFQGAHCLRHSYAVHLLREGTSIKTIGDVLGHRSLESTCVYLRLSIEDLRSVPLNLPSSAAGRRQ